MKIPQCTVKFEAGEDNRITQLWKFLMRNIRDTVKVICRLLRNNTKNLAMPPSVKYDNEMCRVQISTWGSAIKLRNGEVPFSNSINLLVKDRPESGIHHNHFQHVFFSCLEKTSNNITRQLLFYFQVWKRNINWSHFEGVKVKTAELKLIDFVLFQF